LSHQEFVPDEQFDKSIQPLESSAATGLKLTISKVLGMNGFAFVLSWIYLVLMGYMLLPKTSDEVNVPVAVVFFVIGQIFASLLIWLLAKRLLSNKEVPRPALPIALCAVVFTSLPSIFAFFLNVDTFIRDIVWILAGFGAVLLIAIWGTMLAKFSHKEVVLFLPIAMLINGVVVFLSLNAFRPETIEYITLALPLLSVALYMVASSKGVDSEELFRAPDYVLTRPPNVPTLLRSSAAMLSNSLLLGFVFYIVATTRSVQLTLLVCTALLAAALFKVYDALGSHRFEIPQVIKVLAPTAAIGLLPLPYADVTIRLSLIAAVVFIAILTETCVWTAICEYTRINRIIPFANIAFGRIGSLLGLGIGYVVAFLVFGSASINGELSNLLILVVIVLAVSVMQVFIFQDNYTPFFVVHYDENDTVNNVYTTKQNRGGFWRQRCGSFSEAHHFTPRQKEVLIMLAKGYSTSYIEETLVVSEHTIKAHIYNIYRKTNVHSRQELIQKIEQHNLTDDSLCEDQNS
jgi:DNA-binding CsgD family transcriptional regulator